MKESLFLKAGTRRHPERRGVALIIVLAFVVILTVLVLALLTRAITDQKISSSNSNRTEDEIFAKGAVDSIVADLQQEIVDGSMTTTPAPGNNVYFPNAPATVPPAIAVPSTLLTGNYPTAANLVKMSASGIPFHPQNANYNNAALPSVACAITTDTPSFNGRSVTTTDWNKALLLPKANTAATAVTPATADFSAPNWILVARDGSNPTTWNANMQSTPATKSAFTPVVGRYAYVIYNEGGLLDADVAGYPTKPTNPLTAVQTGYKSSEALADLSQITSSLSPVLSVSQLVKFYQFLSWRNYASLQHDGLTGASASLTGSFPNYGNWTASNATSYLDNILSNTSGYLRNSAPELVNSQSDQKFATRQQLIDLVTNGLYASTDTADTAAMQNTLQYFGTFTRDLDQPSFVPAVSPYYSATQFANESNPAQFPTVHTYQHSSIDNRGNTLEEWGNDVTDVVPAPNTPTPAQILAQQQLINPEFLSIRVTTQFIRNDGSTAVVGEPLVKKRFALNRLAWLTYKGPSAVVYASSSSDPIISDLETRQGFSAAFLQQGTAANIQKYFGLVWLGGSSPAVGQRWIYAPETSDSTTVATETSIKHLNQVSGREANFIELLKAGILSSSLGIASYDDQHSSGNFPGYSTDGPYYSGDRFVAAADRELDANVIQIAANIIAQTGIDDYPFLIDFAGGGSEYAVNGVWSPNISYTTLPPTNPEVGGTYSGAKNLPGICRIQLTLLTRSAGRYAYVAQPEIWNPNWFSTTTALTPGTTYPNYIGPTVFRIVAREHDDLGGAVSVSPEVSPVIQGAGGTFRNSFEANAAITFNLPTANSTTYQGFFHEPFLIDRPTSAATPVATLTGEDEVSDTSTPTPTSHVGFWFGDSTEYSTASNAGNFVATKAGVYYFLEAQMPDSTWVRYDTFVARMDGTTGVGAQPLGTTEPSTWNSCDPRTMAFGVIASAPNHSISPSPAGQSDIWQNDQAAGVSYVGSYGSACSPGFSNASSARYPFSLNNPVLYPSNFYTDTDAVARGAIGYYATSTSAITTPMSNTYVSPTTAAARPYILHRQFKSVSELGYVFRGTPWRNLDFSTPSSGDAALLDIFCIRDTSGSNGVVAGRLDLNTRQEPVIQALISSAMRDEATPSYLPSTGGTTSQIGKLAQLLVTRTTGSSPGVSPTATPYYAPLANRSELVGRYQNPPPAFTPGTTAGSALIPSTTAPTYTGYSGDVALSGLGGDPDSTGIQYRRVMESVERALGDVGTTRTWNLLIDVVAQTGRYPATATSADQFLVEGERRYWVHIAIDRMTGAIIDQSWEPVSE